MEISALAAAGDADAGGAGVTKRLFPLSYFGHTCALFWIRLLARKKCKALNPFEYTAESLGQQLIYLFSKIRSLVFILSCEPVS